mmetsp:Transcript_12173/g.37884  ORF Transcript_12173/g.37884 Transcript_12173/m.37884 type:complete len:141 (-) Transcript_12173:78-500(-)
MMKCALLVVLIAVALVSAAAANEAPAPTEAGAMPSTVNAPTSGQPEKKSKCPVTRLFRMLDPRNWLAAIQGALTGGGADADAVRRCPVTGKAIDDASVTDEEASKCPFAKLARARATANGGAATAQDLPAGADGAATGDL